MTSKKKRKKSGDDDDEEDEDDLKRKSMIRKSIYERDNIFKKPYETNE